MAADLSLQEAARRYALSLPTLGRRIRNWEIVAYKSEGGNRGEWRVSAKALEDFGYKRRSQPSVNGKDTALPRDRRAQRRKAEQADRKPGASEDVKPAETRSR